MFPVSDLSENLLLCVFDHEAVGSDRSLGTKQISISDLTVVRAPFYALPVLVCASWRGLFPAHDPPLPPLCLTPVAQGKEHDFWAGLEGIASTDSGKVEATGQVHLALELLSPSSPEWNTPDSLQGGMNGALCARISLSSHCAASTFAGSRSAGILLRCRDHLIALLPVTGKEEVLKVTVVEAADLTAMRANGPADPCVKLTIGDSKIETPAVAKTLAPMVRTRSPRVHAIIYDTRTRPHRGGSSLHTRRL